MSNLLTYIQSQTKPKYTDLQQTSLSQYIKTQTAKTPQQTVTPKPTNPSTQKYGTVNGKTTLPSHIENQGLYDLNENNVFVHEMIHWDDAQRYIEKHGDIDNGYIDAIRAESKRHIEKLIDGGYNIKEISEYAYKSYLKGNFDETWTEYRVKQALGGK